jgi:hypothetical protein
VNPGVMGPITTAADLRRVAIAAAGLAAVGVVALVVIGRPLMALFLVLGFALGMFNTLLLRRAAARFATVDGEGKRRFALGALGRLALITALALAIGVLVQPDGIGIFLGLAAFQLLLVGVALVPLLKELRQQEGTEG